jgi:hypothetical protein
MMTTITGSLVTSPQNSGVDLVLDAASQVITGFSLTPHQNSCVELFLYTRNKSSNRWFFTDVTSKLLC